MVCFTAQVEIFIENVNDNPLVFEDFNKNSTIEEKKLDILPP